MKTAHKSQGAEPASARNRRARTAATCSVLLLTALHFAGHLPWLRARAAETLGELRPGGWMPPQLTWRLLWMALAWLWNDVASGRTALIAGGEWDCERPEAALARL